MEKMLGKISSAHFGLDRDRPFLFGLELCFTGDGWGTYGIYLQNIADSCEWESENKRNELFFKLCKKVENILKQAKVNGVDELVGKPVEVTFENNSFKDFRILTEVL